MIHPIRGFKVNDFVVCGNDVIKIHDLSMFK